VDTTRAFRLALWFALVFVPAVALAADAPKGDAKSAQLLDEVIKTYRALPAYEDHGSVVMELDVAGALKRKSIPQRLAFTRPNKLLVESGVARLTCDGEKLSVAVEPLKTYTSVEAPKSVTFNTLFTAGSAGSEVLGGPGGPMMHILLNLLVGTDPAKTLGDFGDTIALEKDQDVDGRACRALRLSSETGTSYRLLIDAETKLLHGIDVVYDPKSLDVLLPASAKVRLVSYRWSAGEVGTKPVADDRFAFVSPKGFAKVEGLAEAREPADEKPKFKVQERVDKPAPNFALTILESDGKTRTASRDDLAGKVVVIDFWATWCGPCLQELPEVQKLVQAYAKDKKPVIVVAVSQDNDPRDPIEVRKLVESTLTKQKIELTGNAVGFIAIDPSNSVGEAFDVEGYPTVVILDEKGILRAAHVGNSPDVRERLTADIDALLAGKPVPKEGAKK
jgi:thiol-disulfide isomerase/thioredoxin